MFNVSHEHAPDDKSFHALCMSTNDHEAAADTDLGVTNKFWQAGKFADVQPMNNEDELSISKYIKYEGTKYSN